VEWFDPRNGGSLQQGSTPVVVPSVPSGGGFLLPSGAPPSSASEDWVILVRRSANRPPVVTDFTVVPAPVSLSGPLVARIRVLDPDGPDDIAQVGMAFEAPGGFLGTVPTVSRGGDLFTVSRDSAAGLNLGTWSCLAAATDSHGALGGRPGSFTVVP
jgi:hypothetical protein